MIELANQLLEWNKKYLTHNSDLTVDKISEVFADKFNVFANGRSYDIDSKAYFEFLQGFRATIKDINYIVHDYIISDKSVVLPKTAQITRLDESIDIFEAILWLKYNDKNKIILWHEVYVENKWFF